ncbi:MAG: hypothetical protein JSU94_16770, partial [Phycisphaerales bacterium]
NRDRWLASLEPSLDDKGTPARSDDVIYWSQISDVGDYCARRGWLTQKVVISNKAVVDEHQPIALDPNGILLPQFADADGDGVGDANWIELGRVTSSRGERIFAAIRIVDNCTMLNANTGFKFSPYDPCLPHVDGSSLLNVSFMGLAGRPGRPPTVAEEKDLLWARADYGQRLDPCDLTAYERDVIWRYAEPNGPYTPFDMGDELELRNRFLLNHQGVRSRLEQLGSPNRWTFAFRDPNGLKMPISPRTSSLGEWFLRASMSFDPNDPNVYDLRHLATTCSMDRIITPRPLIDRVGMVAKKMVSINAPDEVLLRDAIATGLLEANPGMNRLPAARAAAQIAANIIDYRDADYEPTMCIDQNSQNVYGFERPCVYISELACVFKTVGQETIRSYAVELYNPYFEDDPNAAVWQLEIDDEPIPINWSGTRRFHVVRFQDPALDPNDANSPVLDANFVDPGEPADTTAYGYLRTDYAGTVQDAAYKEFSAQSTIKLVRRLSNGVPLEVDSVTVPGGWTAIDGDVHSIQRDISRHKCIRRLWDERATKKDSPTLGQHNSFVHSDSRMVQAHPYMDPRIYGGRGFKNVGEIGMVLAINAYDANSVKGCTDATAKLDLGNPKYADILRYLTVFDPTADGIDNDGDGRIDANQPDGGEFKIPGRININTAPEFVIGQLPWVSPQIARAIVAFRDTVARGFRCISDLLYVPEMRFYAVQPGDLGGFPDLTPNDGDPNDIEERDVIFQRISNLVTVRSDVFTAYILVRIGVDGPQRRVVAILDRSDVYSADDRVKILALHVVPDPK